LDTPSYNVLVGNPGGTRTLGRPRYKRGDDIRMVLTEIWWEGVDWIHLAQDKTKDGFHKRAGDFLTS
jgi:hypothetical protein